MVIVILSDKNRTVFNRNDYISSYLQIHDASPDEGLLINGMSRGQILTALQENFTQFVKTSTGLPDQAAATYTSDITQAIGGHIRERATRQLRQ